MKSFLPVPDPIAFRVFGLEVRWYAISLVVAIIAAVIVMYWRAPKYGVTPRDRVLDFVLWVVPIGVIGCRTYYVIFEWEKYKGDFWSVFKIWEGGIAIHGGLIFGITTAIILVRHWKQSPLKWLDLVAPALALAQSIGRWGNYFNSEAHGTPTTLPWAIEVNGELVHPTFLYASIWDFLLFLLLLWIEMSGRRKFDGQLILTHLMVYSFGRFFNEGLRTDSLMIGSLRQAQVISVCIFVFALLLYIFLAKRAKKKGTYGAESLALASAKTQKKHGYKPQAEESAVEEPASPEASAEKPAVIDAAAAETEATEAVEAISKEPASEEVSAQQ